MTNYRHAKMIDIIGEMDSPLLTVYAQRCLLVRNRNAECLKCAAVCTTGAISRTENGVAVDPSLCIGCGTCATACPTCCLEAQNPSDEDLAESMRAALRESCGTVVFACEGAFSEAAAKLGVAATKSWVTGDGDKIVPVACLGRLDESFLVEATARGACKIALISGNCSRCEHESGGKLCGSICQSTDQLIAAMGRENPISRTFAKDAEIRPCEADEATEPKADWHVPKPKHPARFAHVQEDGTLPHFVPQRRLRLFNSLKRLGQPKAQAIKNRLWGQASINTDLCRSCRMCTVFCPTGAVTRFEGGDGSFGVEHRPTLCAQCGMCETICPEGAIKISDEIALQDLLAGRKSRFEMQPVDWSPNTMDAIPTRMARLIKTNAIQDPQGRMDINQVAKQRAYSLERQKQRQDASSDRR